MAHPLLTRTRRTGATPGDLLDDVEPLDETRGFLGMGRSRTFPFPQWRARDQHRTVFFDEGQGHPLVFVHGLGGNATHWEFLARDLVHHYRVVGLDLVGLGWSNKPQGSYTIDFLRDHLFSFLDQQRIRGATLVGHSLGGAVCTAAALARPGQFESLVLMCAAGLAPAPSWMRCAAPIFLHRELLYRTLLHGSDLIVRKVFADDAAGNPHVQWFRDSALRDEPGNPNLRDFARVCETLCWDVLRRDLRRDLAHLHLPVLALWADQDRLTSLPRALRELNAVRRLRTVVLRRCGHLPMIERPRETLHHLRLFLQNPP